MVCFLALMLITCYLKIYSEGFFHVLCDELDKLVRQCQAIQSHLQIGESSAIDLYTSTNQVLMSDNPESQRALEIFLE